MFRRILLFVVWITLTSIMWFLDGLYPGVNLQRVTLTLFALAIVYFLFSIIGKNAAGHRIKDSKARYAALKTISILEVAVFLCVVIYIWVRDPQSLVTAYGLVAAGVAIALQDLLKNFAGGISILFSDLYRVGDRIELDGRIGDVIDIGILYTTLIETIASPGSEQATGRLVLIPNGAVLSKTIDNYTKDHSFVWAEIIVPLTYDSDWKTAVQTFQKIAAKETKEMAEKAAKQIRGLQRKYYLDQQNVAPRVTIKLTDNGIHISVRYVTDVRIRASIRDTISKRILEAIERSKKMEIAVSSLDISVKELPK